MAGELTKTTADNIAKPWTDAASRDLFGTTSSRVTQLALESLIAGIPSNANVTQICLEVLVKIVIEQGVADTLTILDVVEIDLVSLTGDKVVSDDLANWNDTFEFLFSHSLEFTDTNEANWNDSVEVVLSISLEVLDNAFAFYDEVEFFAPIYQIPLQASVADNLNELEDSLDSISLIFYAEEITYELGDIFSLHDNIELQNDIYLEIEDDLNNWLDEVEDMPGDYVDYAYDTMMYDFLDAIEIDLRSQRGISDSFTLSDAITTSLVSYLQTKSVVDSLNNWLDTISVKEVQNQGVGDYLHQNDSIKLFLTHALRLNELLVLTDSVQARLSTDEETLSDALNLWNDLVSVEMTVRLEVVKADSFTLSDATSNSGIKEDTSYYRRYLNDVLT